MDFRRSRCSRPATSEAWKDAPLIDHRQRRQRARVAEDARLGAVDHQGTSIPSSRGTPVSKPAELQEVPALHDRPQFAETQAAIKDRQDVGPNGLRRNAVTAKYADYKSDRLRAAIETIYKESGKSNVQTEREQASACRSPVSILHSFHARAAAAVSDSRFVSHNTASPFSGRGPLASTLSLSGMTSGWLCPSSRRQTVRATQELLDARPSARRQ